MIEFLTTTITFIAVLGILVFVHELGHFLAAKLFKIRVDEFCLGFPPKMFRFKKGETEYGVNWIPLGGYVKIKGEDGEGKDDPDSYASKPIWQRAIVLFAGVLMNFLTAVFFISIGFMIGLNTDIESNIPFRDKAIISDVNFMILDVNKELPAAKAGLKMGDIIVSVNENTFDSTHDLIDYVKQNDDKLLSIKIKRQDQIFDYNITPAYSEDLKHHTIGMTFSKNAKVSYPIHIAFYEGFRTTSILTVKILQELSKLVMGKAKNVQLAGPVGIAVKTGEFSSLGFSFLLQFTALLSLNLCILNLLPIPALDGAKLLLLIVEKIRGKALNQKIENTIHLIGFAFLMILTLIVTFNDILIYGRKAFDAIGGWFLSNNRNMKQKELFVKINKNNLKDEPSLNAQLLIKAAFIDKTMAGVYTLLPLGLRVIKNIENIIREEINKVNGLEVLMPALHSLENYKKTGRENIDVLFYTELSNKKKLLLGQSHEEIVVPLVQKFAQSYKDFPVKVYQFQNKFRNELRAKSGILRTREFIMKDLYSFHTSEDDLNNYYDEVKQAYDNIYKRLGLAEQTYFTYASGGTFSKYSHEYQALTNAGEDNIYICHSCKIAINEEIINDLEHKCPLCGNDSLEQQKSVEVANIFKLKTKFSDAFDYKFIDKDGQAKDIFMGCYGIGLGRNMGTIVEIHHDEQGIIWPKEVTPFKVHLLILGKDDKLKNQANKFYQKLQDNNISVLYDDREDKSIGEKFLEADLIGIPIRLVIGNKTNGQIELKYRNSKETILYSEDEILGKINEFYK